MQACSLMPNTTPTPSPSCRDALLEVVHSDLPDPPGDLGCRPVCLCLTPPLPLHHLTVRLFCRWSTLVSTIHQEISGMGLVTSVKHHPTPSPPYREALLEVVHPGLADPPGDLWGWSGHGHLLPPLPLHLLTVRLFCRWSTLVLPIHQEISGVGLVTSTYYHPYPFTSLP